MISPSGHPSLKKGGESYLIEYLLNIIPSLKLILEIGFGEEFLSWGRFPIVIGMEETSLNS
jgi:hypothetical protein